MTEASISNLFIPDMRTEMRDVSNNSRRIQLARKWIEIAAKVIASGRVSEGVELLIALRHELGQDYAPI